MGLDDWLNRDQARASRGRVQQRGLGGFILCDRCNALCGQRYIPELIKLTRAGAHLHAELPSLTEVQEIDLVESRVGAEIRGIQPLAVSKQMVAMALCCDVAEFDRRAALAEFVLDRTAIGLPEGVRLWLVLYRGPISRRSGISGRLQAETGEWHTFTEVAHPPFSYLLSLDDPSPLLPCGEVTSFASYAFGEIPDLALELLVGYGNTAFPADFRTAATVAREREQPDAAVS